MEFHQGMDEEMTAYGSGLKGRQGQMVQWESATGHLTRRTEQMRLSIDRADLHSQICLHGGFRPPQCLLEGQHSKATAIQEVLQLHG